MTEGFRKPVRTITVYFEDTDFAGAEVKLSRNVSFATLYQLDDFKDDRNLSALAELFTKEMVLSWNLEDEKGEPTPITSEGLLSWPPDFILMLFGKWRDTVLQPPAPLSERLPNGSMADAEALNLQEFTKLN